MTSKKITEAALIAVVLFTLGSLIVAQGQFNWGVAVGSVLVAAVYAYCTRKS